MIRVFAYISLFKIKIFNFIDSYCRLNYHTTLYIIIKKTKNAFHKASVSVT